MNSRTWTTPSVVLSALGAAMIVAACGPQNGEPVVASAAPAPTQAPAPVRAAPAPAPAPVAAAASDDWESF